MAAQAAPSVAAAERLALRQQAAQTRLAARRTIRRAVGIYARATKQHAELVRVRELPQARGSDHGQSAGSSLAQLLQPLLAVERPRPSPPSAGTERALPAVRSARSRELRLQLEGSLAARSRPSTTSSSSPASPRPARGPATCIWSLHRNSHPPGLPTVAGSRGLPRASYSAAAAGHTRARRSQQHRGVGDSGVPPVGVGSRAAMV